MKNVREKIKKKIRKIEILSGLKSRSYLFGAFRSVFRGKGYDFRELSEYRPGDPVRHIDWKKFSYTNVPYLKTFDDERERRIVFMVDISGSMSKGFTQSKSESACEFVAYLSNAALLNKDLVSLCVFDKDIREWLPFTKNPGSPYIFAEKSFTAGGAESVPDWGTVFKKALLHIRKHYIVFIISDFRGWDFKSGQMRFMRSMADVIGIYITHIGDIPAAIRSSLPFSDGRGAVSYKEALGIEAEFTEKLKRDFNAVRPSFLRASTADDPLLLIRKLFGERARNG